MLHKTRGIVFRTTDFSESSLVVKVYTELYGLQTYMVNSVRKKNARVRSSVFQSLSLVEMVVYHKERGGIQRIAEIRPMPVLRTVPFDVLKSSMALFLNEVLYKSIHEEEANAQLFDFLFHSIQWLDVHEPANSDFHLLFLLQLSKYLGFFPDDNFSEENKYFDLQEGNFQPVSPPHPLFLNPALSMHLHQILRKLPDFSAGFNIPLGEKRELIERILEYYQLHISGFGNIKSHKVLEQIWA
ncbi:MAG TPA: DNA repair protein RecO [Bacteroidia bacterium]|nr:DNA repair protein RecO [Bacteroidia bacterium]HNS11969.1 DNA repair protein RecO [Bacteroidia bacterium]